MAPRIVLITGANRGLGLAILLGLAQRSPNDHYLLGSRDWDSGTGSVAQLLSLGVTSKIDVVRLDVTSDESIKGAAKEVEQKYGRLDVLVNNAGISLLPSSLSDLRSTSNMIFDTNVSSVALLMMSFLPLLRASADGRIINVSSTPASLGLSHTMPIIGDPSYIPYMVSKTALNMLTLCYSKIRGNEDVLFQCAGPGLVRTDLNEAARTRPDARTPETGAAVVIELILAERRRFRAGFWYIGDGEKYPKLVPW